MYKLILGRDFIRVTWKTGTLVINNIRGIIYGNKYQKTLICNCWNANRDQKYLKQSITQRSWFHEVVDIGSILEYSEIRTKEK